MKRLVIWLLVLALLGTGGYFGWRYWQDRQKTTAATYRMGEVRRTDVVSSISATGTVVPEDVVDIGAQVNGQIAVFGTDTDGKPVDYRSTVKQDQVLAKIDETLYAADVASGEAQLKQAQASVRVAQASRAQAQAKLEQANRDWLRAQKLGESRALSQADYDASKSSYEQAQAAISLAQAQIGQGEAQVAIAEASLQRSRRNLVYCTIKSPVDGVVIDRRVEIGQTVVSSLNAPSLFLIARDLAQMQVLVQVNEADIGSVRVKAPVMFTAEAFPGDQFKGEVRKVRLNATMTQNVVTYTVEIVTSNPDLKLLPYLTANVRFIVDKRDQVLTVPNAALRWSPPAQAGATGTTTTAPASSSAAAPTPGAPAPSAPDGSAQTPPADRPEGGRRGPRADGEQPSGDRPQGQRPSGERSGGGGGGGGGGGRAARSGQPRPAKVWVMRDGQPTPISVKAGLSDGNVTEIITDELAEGDQVILGEAAVSTAPTTTGTNPFAPQPFRGGPGGGGGRGGR